MPLLFFVSVFFLSSCSSLSYLAENGVGQWKMFNRSRPVEEVMASPHTPGSVREGIAWVQEAKKFAVELGLNATGSYQSYVQLDSPCVVWAVSAAHPLELKEKSWRFPLVGEVPYLGFFNKASAEQELARLAREEVPTPDTWIRCVPAFSSLGWFSDPLYSSILRGKERDVAELVIHESLHATVWVGNSVDFNEKLANFVGLEGSLRYMDKKFGSQAVQEAQKEIMGEKLFGEFLYREVEVYKNKVRNVAEKERFYVSLPERYQAFLVQKKKQGLEFKPLSVKFAGWNNSALLSFVNYYSDFSVFEKMLRSCNGDLGRFVQWIVAEKRKKTGRFLSAPEEHLAELVKSSSCN